MQTLIWVFVGLVGGELANKRLPKKGYGLPLDLGMGFAGAMIGGFLAPSADFAGYVGTFVPALLAVSCAALLTLLASLRRDGTVCISSI